MCSSVNAKFNRGAFDRGTVDAAIWVSPLCTSRATKFPEVCTPLFKAAACYPYCMAARLRGSGSNGLVLYNAPDWHERVHLMGRDCIIDTPVLANPVQAFDTGAAKFMPSGTHSSTDPMPAAEASNEGDVVQGASVIAGKWDPSTMGCVYSRSGKTIVLSSAHPSYGPGGSNLTTTPAQLQQRTARSILMQGQPFAYAGDVTLTATHAGNGEYWVSVDRLYGNEVNEYTMVNVRAKFPANPPADTIQMGGRLEEQVDRLPIPYSFSDMAGVQHPAVSTRTSVFFAVNPSLAMFKGFARGCFTEGYEWSLQLSALSSYAPIKIWKIDPFAYCPHGHDGTEMCGIGRVHHAEVPDAFTKIVPAGQEGNAEAYNVFDARKCTVPFAVAVVGMDYINEENIAVTVLRAPFSEYSPDTGLLKADAKSASYQVYFLSTVTMAMSSVPHERDVIVSASAAGEGALCPAMRRLPNVGSFFAEVAVAGVEVVHKFFDVVIMLPALGQMLDRQLACPLVTHGHTLMQRCGADLLSLDEFFDALNRANAHFWRAFAIVAERVRDMGVDRVANVIDGVAYYGESSMSPTDTYASFVRAVRIPTKEMGTEILQGVVPMARG